MTHIPNTIFLNGNKLSASDISVLNLESSANASAAEWEKELYGFLNEWFSDSNYIMAQTSGSTGEPKPIELSKSFMRCSAERTIEYFGLNKGSRILLSLPCRYIAGKMMVVRAIVGQMNLVTVDPACDFEFLADESFDFGAMVPNQVFKLLEQPLGIGKLEHITNLLVGGSSISSELEAQIGTLSSRVVLTYGMTETASHIAIRELSGERKSDVYRCLRDISVSLNKEGCLEIHLPDFNLNLLTSDLAELQSPTSFRILGRADSVIISGGIKYSPELLEKKIAALMRQPFVISAVPDDKLGEKIVLVIEGEPFETRDLEKKLSALLSPFELPKSILFQSTLESTASGKWKRDAIKKLL